MIISRIWRNDSPLWPRVYICSSAEKVINSTVYRYLDIAGNFGSIIEGFNKNVEIISRNIFTKFVTVTDTIFSERTLSHTTLIIWCLDCFTPFFIYVMSLFTIWISNSKDSLELFKLELGPSCNSKIPFCGVVIFVCYLLVADDTFKCIIIILI